MKQTFLTAILFMAIFISCGGDVGDLPDLAENEGPTCNLLSYDIESDAISGSLKDLGGESFSVKSIELGNGLIQINQAKFIAKGFAAYESELFDINLSVCNTEPVFYKDVKIAYVAKFCNAGFVLLSAMPETTPVQMVSHKSNFNRIKKSHLYLAIAEELYNTYEFLEYEGGNIVERLNQLDDDVYKRIEGNKNRWTKLYQRSGGANVRSLVGGGDTAPEILQPLFTTNWYRRGDWNDEIDGGGLVCDRDNDGTNDDQYEAGCTAIAMGQLMYYWKWPITSTYRTYDWDKIMDNDDPFGEAAKLIADAADSVNMSYGCDASAAPSTNSKDAFVNDFGYDSHDIYANTDTSLTDFGPWWNHTYFDLTHGRPVIFTIGNVPSGGGWGHSVVADGYRDDTDQLHFDWGNSTEDSDVWAALGSVPNAGNQAYRITTHINPQAEYYEHYKKGVIYGDGTQLYNGDSGTTFDMDFSSSFTSWNQKISILKVYQGWKALICDCPSCDPSCENGCQEIIASDGDETVSNSTLISWSLNNDISCIKVNQFDYGKEIVSITSNFMVNF